MGRPEKKIGCLCLLLLVSSGWMAFASRPSTESALPGTGEQVHPASAPSFPSPFLSDPHRASAPGMHLGNGELFFKMMLSVGLVLGLGGAALYLSKRVLPRVARAGGKEIRILETAGLGPRKALHLVEVSGQRLLLASTNESVTMLASLNDAWPGVPDTPFCVGEPLDLSKPQLGKAVKT